MSPTPKAQRLRNRLSINPDELPPAPTRPAPATTIESTSRSSTTVKRARTGTSTTRDDAPSPTVPNPAPRTPGRAGERRRQSAAPAHVSAVDDPSITAGRKDYRSFYIEDATFARFRAAIYWLARREHAAGEVPENMSVAVENPDARNGRRARSSLQRRRDLPHATGLAPAPQHLTPACYLLPVL
jgi:hypothetical protein